MNHLQHTLLTETAQQLEAIEIRVSLLKAQSDALRSRLLAEMTDLDVQVFATTDNQFTKSCRVTVKVIDEEDLVRTLQEKEKTAGLVLVQYVPSHFQPTTQALDLIKTGVLVAPASVKVSSTIYIQVKKN